MNPVSPALLPTYVRAELAFERGEGVRLYTAEGEAYLDFMAGVAVNSLGHAHPHLVAALTEQAGKLWHVSNLYRIPGQERLGERLVENSFADMVFFANSGAEAMELAIKMARKYHSANGEPQRYRIITFEGAFHGRTLATVAAGGQPKYLEGFGPKVEGFDQVPFGDQGAVERAVGPETGAILIEPVQGEGGVRALPPQFLRGLRELCDARGLLLVLDEVQTGVGRTGTLFAYEKTGAAPDIMAIAKGIGGGFPLGACLATREAAKGMTAGTHGSTFGGNPLAMAVGNAVLDVVLAPGFLDEVTRKALLLKQRLAGLLDRHPEVVTELRGDGLLLGLKCRMPAGDVVEALRRRKLLAITAGDNVLRLAPPLVVSDQDIDEAVSIMDAAFAELTQPAMRAAG
ncbi:MAG: aspartate aminotransferase family protein [Pseudomonadota bacterium]|nr:aspartate aminotransferase family protein [Pseudomonadota bacterium]